MVEPSQIQAMQKLGLTKEEIKDIIQKDEIIDKNLDKTLFELQGEQKKASKQARNCGKPPTVYNFTKRERKADTQKSDIIRKLAEIVQTLENVSNLDITNKEREINFVQNDRKFKIVLSAPRK